MLSREHPVSGKRPPLVISLALTLGLIAAAGPHAATFDHSYQSYSGILAAVVRGPRVDYPALVGRKKDLDLAVSQFAAPSEDAERGWTRPERIAFWINAYNLFTLKAVADRYPVRGIREIRGVWTELRLRAASRDLTLDDIEHRILRPVFKDPRVHFAINCASISCPPLREEPYLAARLDAQLDDAARRYLGSPLGLQLRDRTLHVSSIFKWYGDDFGPNGVLRTIATYGSKAAQDAARSPGARVRFLPYDWSLNDAAR